MTTFDPNTPPRTDDPIAEEVPTNSHLRQTGAGIGASAQQIEHQNADEAAHVEERWRRDVIGTTQAQAAHSTAEFRERVDAENQARRARTAAGGGAAVTSTLRGAIGEQVSEIVRVDQVEAMFKRIRNSITDERAEVVQSEGPGPSAAHLAELVDAAIEAAETKRGSVPSVVGEHLGWLDQRRIAMTGRAHQTALALAELDRRHVEAKLQRITDRLPEVDAIIVEFATDVLDKARAAHEALANADLAVDSTADEVIQAMDIGVQKAWNTWRTAVSEWSDLQSARRYIVEAAKGRGPQQGKGAYAVTQAGVDVSAETWRSQFSGVELPAHVEGSQSALRWWVDQGSDVTPAGVSDADDEGSEA